MRCDPINPQEIRPCSSRPPSQSPSLSPLYRSHLLRPRAPTPRTTCSSTASTSVLTRIRLFVQRSRVTLKRAGDSGPPCAPQLILPGIFYCRGGWDALDIPPEVMDA